MKRILNKLNRFFYSNLRLAVLDETAGRWVVKFSSNIISYLKAQNHNGRHILLKPAEHVEPYYMQVDDIGDELLNRQHRNESGEWKPGRLIVETSPSNYQVWIHSSRYLSIEEKRFWLKKLHSDPGADPKNRWGRCPGFRNRKLKHKDINGGYPLAKLIWIDWKEKVDIPQNLSTLPQGGSVSKKSISRSAYERGNESSTDFAYTLALIRFGYSDNEIRIRLLSERSNWTNHASERKRMDYLRRTIQKARGIVDKCYVSHYLNQIRDIFPELNDLFYFSYYILNNTPPYLAIPRHIPPNTIQKTASRTQNQIPKRLTSKQLLPILYQTRIWVE